MTFYVRSTLNEQQALEIGEVLLTTIKDETKENVIEYMQSNITGNIHPIIFPPPAQHLADATWQDKRLQDMRKQLLPVACERGDKDIVLLLLHHGADLFMRSDQGSPLEITTIRGNVDVIAILVAFEPDLLKDNSQLLACLALACRHGHINLVDFWMEHLIDNISPDTFSDCVFPDEYHPVRAAREGGQEDIIRKLLNRWIDDDDTPESVQDQKAAAYYEYIRKVAKWSQRNLATVNTAWLHLSNPNEILTSIDLSNNKELSCIPEDLIWGLPHMEKLKLSQCSLREIPEIQSNHNIDGLRLRNLDLSGNKLKQMRMDIFMIPRLTHLELQHNEIHTMEGISQTLLSDSQTEDISDIMWRCENLEDLNMEHNKLQNISPGIKAASQLRTLKVNNNNLTSLPQSWLCPLEKLHAQHNRLSQLQRMTNWRRTLKTLDISSNKFELFPLSICNLHALEELNISYNEIWRLPDKRDWHTYRLRILNMSNNHLMSFSSDVKKMLLTETEDTIIRREWIHLTGNTSQPNWLQDIQDQLSAQSVFPTVLSTRLQTLDISNNRFQQLPDSICDMKNLQMLYINGNCAITRLPDKLGLLQKLFVLDLTGLNIKEPKEVLQIVQDRGGQRMNTATTIVKALKERLLMYQPYRGVKLMMIGPQRSGKTTVLKRLLDGQYVEYEDQNGTVNDHQVQLQTWTKSRPSWLSMVTTPTDPIQFTIWDLKGGGDIALISQSLFTSNTIYVLVWNAQYSEDKKLMAEIRAWMLNVKVLAPGCRIVAVGSHLDKLKKSGKKNTLRHLLHEETNLIHLIADEVLVDAYNRNGSGLKRLSQVIFEYALNMTDELRQVQLIGRKVPATFIRMKELLNEELKRHQRRHNKEPRIMTGDKFLEFLRSIDGEHDIDRSGERPLLLRFLRETGSLIHVSDHTYRLTNLFFLDPNWLCKVLIDAAMTKPQTIQGHCPQSVPKEFLKAQCTRSGFGEERFSEYLELLGRFEIAIRTTEDSYILPALLTAERPFVQGKSPASFLHTLLRLYKLSFLPPGFFSRLIGRILADTGRNERYGESTSMAWQQGISIKTDLQQIDVELRANDGTGHGVNVVYIFVSVKSESKEHIARGTGFVIDHIEYLIKEWYTEIEGPYHTSAVQRLVPCPTCADMVQQQDDGKIDDIAKISNNFTELTVTAIVKDTIQCPGGHTIDLRDVVPDLFLLDLGVAVLDETKLKMIRKLGEGGFGVVYEASHSGESLAIKSLLKSGFDGKTQPSEQLSDELSDSVILHFPDFRREIAVMSRLQHPCILQLKSVSIRKLWFAMEFAPLGDLARYVDEQLYIRMSGMSSNQIRGTTLERMLTFKIAYQLVTAVEYLHQQEVIHTDLKTDNILLFSTRHKDLINVKLADYGISQSLATGAVRGQAGNHAFVAPEIIDGKAFNERVDIFSIGMILYHTITGVSPGGHDIAINTTLDTTSGVRPTFEFQDYTLFPNFPHLVTIMESCWKTNPNERPSASEVLDRMKQPGFSCLVQNVPLVNIKEAYLSHTNDYSGCLYLWVTGKGGRILCNVNLETVKKRFYENPVDSRVLCAYHCEQFLFIGTDTEGIHAFEQQPTGFPRTTLKQSKELRFPVSSLLYVKGVGEDRSKNCLYVGLQDGRIAVYQYMDDGTWSLPTFCMMSAAALPCNCMVHLKKDNGRSQRLIVGCGNTIRAVNTFDHSVESSTMCIPHSSGKHVVGLVSAGGHIWCHLSDSTRVYQFNESSGAHTSSFECGMTELTVKGDSLVIHGPRRSTLPEGSYSSETIHDSALMQHNPDNPVSRIRYKTTFPTKPVEVKCLLAVKDTLWIGRSSGDILVVDIGTTGDFGELQALLRVDPIVGLPLGPVKSLLNPTPGQVIACREVVQEHGNLDYQILVWQDWGRNESDEYEHSLLFQ